MTTPTDIDRTAPVIVHHQIDINAPLETIWRLQTNVNNWPAWQADITAARLDGPFEPLPHPVGRPHPRHHGHPRILERPARRSRPHRDAIGPGQVTDRLARPPQSHRRIHKLTSAGPGVHLRHDPVLR